MVVFGSFLVGIFCGFLCHKAVRGCEWSIFVNQVVHHVIHNNDTTDIRFIANIYIYNMNIDNNL